MNARQRAFVAAYAGNATEAARQAGYKGTGRSLEVMGSRLLRNAEIREAIAKRETKRHAGLIATREEVEEKLTAFIRDSPTKEAIAAIGTLAKMRGWSLAKVQVEGSLTLEQLILQAEAKNRGTNGAGAVAKVASEGERKADVPRVEDSPGVPNPPGGPVAGG